MSNPKPTQTQSFIDAQKKPMATPYGNLASRAAQVRLPEQIDQAIRTVDDLSGWLRRVITEAAIREGLIKTPPED
jgi:hypothetical protein